MTNARTELMVHNVSSARSGAIRPFCEARDAGRSLHHHYNWPAIRDALPSSPSVILDAGCGNGSLTASIAELGHSVIGIDSSAKRIEIAESHFPTASFFCRNLYDDLSDILPNGADVCISCEVIEHLYSPDGFLHEAYNVLRPGGLLIITTPYHGWLKNFSISLINGWDRHFMVNQEGAHIKFFSKRTLFDMLERNGFINFEFQGAGRIPLLWKSMVVKAERGK